MIAGEPMATGNAGAPATAGAFPDAGLAAELGRVLVVGAGSMGSAIISGLLGIPGFKAGSLVVCDHHQDRLADLAQRFGCATFSSAAEAAQTLAPDTVILAVRPGNALELARRLEGAAPSGQPLLVSIMSGVSNARLTELFGSWSRVVRVMPNTPLAVGAGMTLVSADAPAGPEAVALAVRVFAAMGDALALPEALFDEGAALSGCGPAYFELVVDALARAGVRHGLSRAVAQRLANQTMLGTATLLARTGKHPQVAIDEVTTPGGTTIAGVQTMEALGLRTALDEGVSAAVERAKGQA